MIVAWREHFFAGWHPSPTFYTHARTSLTPAFRSAGAKDWCSNLAITLNHSGSNHRLQFHHIFPKAVLKSSYTSREADGIANFMF